MLEHGVHSNDFVDYRTHAERVLTWLLTQTRPEPSLGGLLTAFCLNLRAAGFPIVRTVLQLHTHHPQWLGSRIVWRTEFELADVQPIEYGVMQSPVYLDSPIAALHNGAERVRMRLDAPPQPDEYPMYASLRREGITDYVGWPLFFTLDELHTVTFATDRPGGFADDAVVALGSLLPALALTIEVRFKNELARRLLDTYVGPRSGQRILSGMTTRGSGATIVAAIAVFDLRGFSTISDLSPRDEIIGLLNDFFDAVSAPIEGWGGEILKFMGDGLLAIFPLDDASACENALKGVEGARRTIHALNVRREKSGREPLRYGVGVNVGEVMYGNIGTPSRLDFTVIGPAVNAAARLEALSKDLGVSTLFSDAFASQIDTASLAPLGGFQLRGFGSQMEVFGFADEVRSSADSILVRSLAESATVPS